MAFSVLPMRGFNYKPTKGLCLNKKKTNITIENKPTTFKPRFPNIFTLKSISNDISHKSSEKQSPLLIECHSNKKIIHQNKNSIKLNASNR